MNIPFYPPVAGGVPYVVNSTVRCLDSKTCPYAGYCAQGCGEGGFCCRKRGARCPREAQDVAPASHHTCVKYRLPGMYGLYHFPNYVSCK